MGDYEKLLDSAYEKVKVVKGAGERFEIPKIEGFFQGKKTILTNLFQIASYARRNPEHLLKFLTKELAAKATINGEKVELNIKIPSKKIIPKIERYIEEFVLCKECKKPDTELIKEGKQTIVHCLACGAKHSVRTKI